MRKSFRVTGLVLAAALCLCLAACGGAGSAGTATPAPTETASDLAYIKDNGKMLIGYTVYEPMNYTDSNGVFTGFDTELAEAVCEKLGVTPEFVEINWDTKEVELNAKSIDCIWNGLTITADRQATMEITVPYVKNAQVVIMRPMPPMTAPPPWPTRPFAPRQAPPARRPSRATRISPRRPMYPRISRPTASWKWPPAPVTPPCSI
jgi:hypothetical protein